MTKTQLRSEGKLIELEAQSFHIAVPDENSPEKMACVLKVEPDTLIWRDTLEGVGNVVLKMYRNRGWIAGARNRWTSCRVEREYKCLERFAAHDIPSARPLFWAKGYDESSRYYEILCTREIEECENLREYVHANRELILPDDLTPLFHAIRRMHECGVRHGALSLKNVLVRKRTGAGFSFRIVDCSRAVIFPFDITGSRMASFDLLDICRKIASNWQLDACRSLLSAYGLAPGDSDAVIRRVMKYRRNKHTRNRLQGEFAIRSLFANRKLWQTTSETP